jgi:hypothetical protein
MEFDPPPDEPLPRPVGSIAFTPDRDYDPRLDELKREIRELRQRVEKLEQGTDSRGRKPGLLEQIAALFKR